MDSTSLHFYWSENNGYWVVNQFDWRWHLTNYQRNEKEAAVYADQHENHYAKYDECPVYIGTISQVNNRQQFFPEYVRPELEQVIPVIMHAMKTGAEVPLRSLLTEISISNKHLDYCEQTI